MPLYGSSHKVVDVEVAEAWLSLLLERVYGTKEIAVVGAEAAGPPAPADFPAAPAYAWPPSSCPC